MATNSDLRTIGLGFCWQDYEVGDRFQTIGRTVTEADLVNFINTTGMTEVMFNNLVYIEEKSAVKGRA
ncbi:MAG: acyl dehydratase, partial [Pseudomonadota bacterium]|nr:acyl dehydratase [Pseudomonadota bacterium]